MYFEFVKAAIFAIIGASIVAGAIMVLTVTKAKITKAKLVTSLKISQLILKTEPLTPKAVQLPITAIEPIERKITESTESLLEQESSNSSCSSNCYLCLKRKRFTQ